QNAAHGASRGNAGRRNANLPLELSPGGATESLARVPHGSLSPLRGFNDELKRGGGPPVPMADAMGYILSPLRGFGSRRGASTCQPDEWNRRPRRATALRPGVRPHLLFGVVAAPHQRSRLDVPQAPRLPALLPRRELIRVDPPYDRQVVG